LTVIIDRGEQRQQLPQPLERAADAVVTQRDRIAQQHRCEGVGSAEFGGAAFALLDQRRQQAVIIRRTRRVHVLAGDVPERDLEFLGQPQAAGGDPTAGHAGGE
jgi:hypothetical protein